MTSQFCCQIIMIKHISTFNSPNYLKGLSYSFFTVGYTYISWVWIWVPTLNKSSWEFELYFIKSSIKAYIRTICSLVVANICPQVDEQKCFSVQALFINWLVIPWTVNKTRSIILWQSEWRVLREKDVDLYTTATGKCSKRDRWEGGHRY